MFGLVFIYLLRHRIGSIGSHTTLSCTPPPIANSEPLKNFVLCCVFFLGVCRLVDLVVPLQRFVVEEKEPFL